MFWQYEFDNHRYPSILSVQVYINGLVKRTKAQETHPNTMYYSSYLSILRLNQKVEIDENDIICFYFIGDALLVKTKKGISQSLSYHYPTLVRNKIPTNKILQEPIE